MAVKQAHETVERFEDWYERYEVDERTGKLRVGTPGPCANGLWHDFENFKREHGARVANYWKYEEMADAEVVSKKPDLPNVSSGEIAGIVRRTARNVVQHTPNVTIVNQFDDDSAKGILAMHILRAKIIGEELNSNEMQQNLFASTMTSFMLGFDAVVPVLTQQHDGSWKMEYDTIHYRDVFPEPGVKDARKSSTVFVRRYLTRGDVVRLVRNNTSGWDQAALKSLLDSQPPSRQMESVSHQDSKHKVIPTGYEIITWYSDSGDPFLTFSATQKTLLRIEKNKDPLKRHPVHMLILEKDPQQPLGKSQIALVFGRQEFQDLMLNGAMKLWYRNINPTLIGYGTGLNGVPNMSPGKYTNIPNPNAKIEAFEVSTQTLLQYGQISQQNQGSMISLIGAADQQMAAAANAGMSQTPQGVEAQQQMVDITTNNYQKAVEYFFSLYCSYALTMYFAEMRNVEKLVVPAAVRTQLLDQGFPADRIDSESGELKISMKDMATVYNVKCIPGSLVELEDEKQLRILSELLVPISQSMPAFASTQNQEMLSNISAAMAYIIKKQIELSGSAHAGELQGLFGGTKDAQALQSEKVAQLESGLGSLGTELAAATDQTSSLALQLKDQMDLLRESQSLLMEKLGVVTPPSAVQSATPATGVMQ